MTNQNSPTTPTFQRAMELIRVGKTVEAEEVVLKAAEEAASRSGAQSHEYAVAANDLATVLMSVGQYRRAAEVLIPVCSGQPSEDPQARRDLLTFLVNLGRAAELAGDPDTAEQALRFGLEGRLVTYGRQHPGYAFGLEPLAALLLKRGKAAEALDMLEEAVDILWGHTHPRVAAALALRAEALKATGSPTPAFAAKNIDELPDEGVEAVAFHAVERVGQADPKLSRQVLADLIPWLTRRLGPDHSVTLNALVAASNVERMLGPEGDTKNREDLIRQAMGIYERQGRTREAVQALMGLALVRSEAGDIEGAAAAYEQASGRAEGLDDRALRSQVLRNHGLLLAELGRKDPASPQAAERLRGAEDKLSWAVFEAEQSGDKETLGRAEVALGVFLQHANRPGEAKPMVQGGVEHLDPAHPDAITGRSHLRALEAGEPCGCGDPKRATAEAFREFVLTRLPADLLEDVTVVPKERDVDVKVKFNRKPSDDELQHLNRVIQHALEEFRRRVVSPYG